MSCIPTITANCEGIRSIDGNTATFDFSSCSTIGTQGASLPKLFIINQGVSSFTVVVGSSIGTSGPRGAYVVDVIVAPETYQLRIATPEITIQGQVAPTTFFTFKSLQFVIDYQVDYVYSNLFQASARIICVKEGPLRGALPPTFPQTPETLPNLELSILLAETEDGSRFTEVISATMVITDIYKYERCRNCLIKTYTGVTTVSTITVYNPDFYEVIRRCGCDCGDSTCDLVEKINLALECYPGYTVDNVISYLVIVYFLAALLYGCFDLEFLRRSKFCKFLKNLERSRFSVFAQLFTDPKYNFVGMQQEFIL